MRRLSRRTFLQAVGGGAGLAVAVHTLPFRGVRAAPAGDSKTLLVGTNLSNIRTQDPGRTIEVTGMMMEKVTYDTLVTFEAEDLKAPKPLLATAWKVGADGRTYTFSLRSGVKFASGNELTSADVKWSFDRILNLKANTIFLFDGVQEVLAPDPRTVVIRTKAPQPSIVPILSHPGLGILDSKLVMEKGGD
ncbi:MAG TPA: ABC transporter substrate-binding protein, partial [bacterium]|nr:ABC transporter substrate-binding protein [bacterium]